jgi:hypothetical protein
MRQSGLCGLFHHLNWLSANGDPLEELTLAPILDQLDVTLPCPRSSFKID